MRFIIIYSTGRTGSTTLMRILNSNQKIKISGENDGAILHLLRTYRSIKHCLTMRPGEANGMTYDECIKSEIKPCWYTNFDLELVKKGIINTILNIIKVDNSDIMGFKEIRWRKSKNLIDEWLELFPNTQIIFSLHNNLVKQIKSGFWCNLTNNIDDLKLFHKNTLKNYQKHKDKSILIYINEINNIDKIKAMFKLLKLDFNKKKYYKIINNRLEDYS
jgi:hypothetical protein